MLYREIIAVCSEMPTKQITILCGLNGELVNANCFVIHTGQF